MPAVSKRQFKFFEMIKHNPKMQEEKGISKEKASEFVDKVDYKKLPKAKLKKKKQ